MKFMILLTFLFSLGLGAKTDVQRVSLKVKTKDSPIWIQAYQYKNHRDRKEIRLEAFNIPAIGQLNPTLGFGRDTDDDGKIDHFFMIKPFEAIKVYNLGNIDEWGHQAIINKLFTYYESSLAAEIAAPIGAIVGTIMFSISNQKNSENMFWVDWIDLEEFQIRVERSYRDGHINRDQYVEGLMTAGTGYKHAADKLKHAYTVEGTALGAIDLTMFFVGGKLFKWFWDKATSLTLKVLPQKIANTVSNVLLKLSTVAEEKILKIKALTGLPMKFLATKAFKKKFEKQMAAIMAKNLLLRRVYFRLAQTEVGVVRANQGWNYIAFMGGVQLASETFTHAKEVIVPDPQSTVQNILNNEDIMHNVGFMTRDAYLMTIASGAIKNKKARYATCGFIALAHSSVSNLWLTHQENPDYARVALDTGWEAVIGNAQVQIDLWALKTFEELSVRKFNPKLKMLGWAVILVEQATGFVIYSKSTEALEEDEAPESAAVKLVPVFAEH